MTKTLAEMNNMNNSLFTVHTGYIARNNIRPSISDMEPSGPSTFCFKRSRYGVSGGR